MVSVVFSKPINLKPNVTFCSRSRVQSANNSAGDDTDNTDAGNTDNTGNTSSLPPAPTKKPEDPTEKATEGAITTDPENINETNTAPSSIGVIVRFKSWLAGIVDYLRALRQPNTGLSV